jgi:hypothetical protein
VEELFYKAPPGVNKDPVRIAAIEKARAGPGGGVA